MILRNRFKNLLFIHSVLNDLCMIYEILDKHLYMKLYGVLHFFVNVTELGLA